MPRSSDHPSTTTLRDAEVVVGALRVGAGVSSRDHGRFDAATHAAHERGIVIATDALPDSDGAVRVGVALAQRDAVDVHLVSVVEPPDVYDTDGAITIDAASLACLMRDARGDQLLEQRDRTFPAAADWPASIELGDRTTRIAASAPSFGAGLLVLGLGEHGLSSRLLARETALRVIREATVPVLAVPADAWGVPHSAVAAIDFTASSEHAARVALDLLGGEGKLYLVHVAPRSPIPLGDPRPWSEQLTHDVGDRLHAIERRLGVPAGVRVEHVCLHGDPATEIVSFAEAHRIDLIAAGNHGRSAVERLVLGSVSTKIVRTARYWVLVAPSRDALESPESETIIG